MTKPPLRCAIYTRKSSDEGLDQAFNTLQAQREACEAYIRSQVGEGWVSLAERYDDGGFSGGTMQRPALQRLMTDVGARKIDVVVVYKVDRLTRFLPDFARIVEAFDKTDVSFVSITQAFNTTTSMGRLTLNMLLSFAQFEREITSERIRDKIAASKAKGMWMGGLPPLGYNAPNDGSRNLAVNVREAAQVRLMFAKLLELGSLPALQRWLESEGLRSKRRVFAGSRIFGDCSFTRGALRHVMSNRIYLGQVVHKGVIHAGGHTALVDEASFDAAQAIIDASRRAPRSAGGRTLMDGLVFDSDGQPMQLISITAKAGKRYRFYGSTRLPDGAQVADDAIRRVPTYAIDDLAQVWAQRLLQREAVGARDVRALIGRLEVHSAATHLVIRTSALPGAMSPAGALIQVRRILQPTEQVLTDPSHAGLLRILLPIRLVMRGGRSWLSTQGGSPLPPYVRPNAKLVQWLRNGHSILSASGVRPDSIRPMLKTRAPTSPRKRALAEFAFLAPDIQQRILSGEIQSVPLGRLPLSWAEQRRVVAQYERDVSSRNRQKVRGD